VFDSPPNIAAQGPETVFDTPAPIIELLFDTVLVHPATTPEQAPETPFARPDPIKETV